MKPFYTNAPLRFVVSRVLLSVNICTVPSHEFYLPGLEKAVTYNTETAVDEDEAVRLINERMDSLVKIISVLLLVQILRGC